jgi:osmotically-inducible protein OsmY
MEEFKYILKKLTCIGLLVISFGCSSTKTHESTGQYVDNTVITVKVKEAIFKEPTLKMLQINVKTYKEQVQLSGFVDSAQNAAKAEELARNVVGVSSVRNDLLVK